jgi:tetratricopeptide (TPR) repeat protein
MFGNLLKGKSERMDEAKEYYQQAANCFKHAQDPTTAVEMYLKCIECESENSFKANLYRDAAAVCKSTNTEQYIQMVLKATELYALSGRGSMAANLARDCAEKLEEDYNYEDAKIYYERAA